MIYNFVQEAGIFAKSICENKLAVLPGFKSRCEVNLRFAGWYVPKRGSWMPVCHWASSARNPCKHRLWVSSASANSYLRILPLLLHFLVQKAAVPVSICEFDWIAVHSFLILVILDFRKVEVLKSSQIFKFSINIFKEQSVWHFSWSSCLNHYWLPWHRVLEIKRSPVPPVFKPGLGGSQTIRSILSQGKITFL